MDDLNDPIQVAGIFKEGNLQPYKFLWHGREYLIKAVNLVYSRFEGRSKIYYFAVSDNANFFKLRFDSGDLTWKIVESIAA